MNGSISIGLSGLEELRRTLADLKDSGVKKATKAGINAGLTVLLQSQRRAINAAPISAEMKSAIRKTLGKRLQKKKDTYVGKAGFGVGKPSTRKKIAAADRSKLGKSGAVGGVGISAANVHWAVLGTGQRRTTAGYARGQMPAFLLGVLAAASESSGSKITAAAAAKMSQVIAAQAARKG